jgi:hypothetical protein
MKNKIVFILGVLFAANAGYSEVPYNQNVRAKCPYIYSVESGLVFGESGIIGRVDSYGAFKSDKFSVQVDCYGLVHDSNGKILGSVMKQGERPIYSKNQDESRERLLYVSRYKADGSVIVRTFDGSEFEPNGKGDAAEKEVDRWYTNRTILRNMENVFVNDICKKEYENGFQVTSDFRIENTTTESKKDSVKFDVAENAKAIIHNHPKRNNESHAWPSLGDIISGLRNPNIDFYIVDCYDKATLIRFDQNTGKVHKIEDAGRETIAVNLEPDFQKEPAYKELMEKIDKVSTLKELEDLLAKKPSEGTGYNHAYLHMPYVPADFELLKKKVMSLRAAEKNKSGTLQNASSKDGNDAGKGVVAKTDATSSDESTRKICTCSEPETFFAGVVMLRILFTEVKKPSARYYCRKCGGFRSGKMFDVVRKGNGIATYPAGVLPPDWDGKIYEETELDEHVKNLLSGFDNSTKATEGR